MVARYHKQAVERLEAKLKQQQAANRCFSASRETSVSHLEPFDAGLGWRSPSERQHSPPAESTAEYHPVVELSEGISMSKSWRTSQASAQNAVMPSAAKEDSTVSSFTCTRESSSVAASPLTRQRHLLQRRLLTKSRKERRESDVKASSFSSSDSLFTRMHNQSSG
jgi:hypothetical protein